VDDAMRDRRPSRSRHPDSENLIRRDLAPSLHYDDNGGGFGRRFAVGARL